MERLSRSVEYRLTRTAVRLPLVSLVAHAVATVESDVTGDFCLAFPSARQKPWRGVSHV